MATRKVPLKKNVDAKYMQVNVLRNIAGMTKRGDDILTHQLGRQCPDARYETRLQWMRENVRHGEKLFKSGF